MEIKYHFYKLTTENARNQRCAAADFGQESGFPQFSTTQSTKSNPSGSNGAWTVPEKPFQA